jgi:hypothetical protein
MPQSNFEIYLYKWRTYGHPDRRFSCGISLHLAVIGENIMDYKRHENREDISEFDHKDWWDEAIIVETDLECLPKLK